MKVGELIQELRRYPASLEVMIEIRDRAAFVSSVEMESGGVSTWITLSSTPGKQEK